MKTRHLLLLIASLGWAGTALAEEKAAGASTTDAPAKETMNVGKMLAGHLIQMVDGSAQDATLKGDPEYFVLYHSASW